MDALRLIHTDKDKEMLYKYIEGMEVTINKLLDRKWPYAKVLLMDHIK